MPSFRFLIHILLIICLLSVLFMPVHAADVRSPVSADEQPAYDTIKVGLYYGSEALTEARLQNEVGSGYLFGYFDDDRIFHEVGRTDVSGLTMLADVNITTEDSISVGCYHILLPGIYTDFDTAKAQADAVGGFPAYYSGEYFVLMGQYETAAEAEGAIPADSNGIVYTASNRCVVVTETGTDRILFEFDCGSAESLAIRPVSEREKPITWFRQLKYHGDFQYARLNGDEHLTVVNYIDIEDYTKGVVPYEMYASWPHEALKAQALCARNFVAVSIGRYRAYGFDVTADTYSQVYRGISEYEAINRAVEETAGQYIRYDGELCQTFFFSSDGGATESSENVWGSAIPYLTGVKDPYEADVNTGSESWTYQYSPKEMTALLNDRMGWKLDTVIGIEAEYSDLGNVISLTITDKNGTVRTVSNNRSVYAVGAKSPHYTITQKKNGNFIIKGSGWGHSCGMSQYGAYAMTKHHEKTAEDIIKFYYSGVYIR